MRCLSARMATGITKVSKLFRSYFAGAPKSVRRCRDLEKKLFLPGQQQPCAIVKSKNLRCLAVGCLRTNNFSTITSSNSRPKRGLLTKIEVEPREREEDEQRFERD